jgi:hypothetical protein
MGYNLGAPGRYWPSRIGIAPLCAAFRSIGAFRALETLRHLAFPENPPATFGLADFRFDQRTFERLAALHPLYDATDADLSAFQRAGGRLIVWHGWSDPHISRSTPSLSSVPFSGGWDRLRIR